MSQNSQIIYKELLDRYRCVQIPMIQRDYAQGRSSESAVRELFLTALEDALRKPIEDDSLPLNLDFIYGTLEDGTRFQPLDGQQRLTTLFLLHWYLAWRDEKWGDFKAIFMWNGEKSKFSYDVRTSSNEFFDQLVCYRPDIHPEEVPGGELPVTTLITNQYWYFRSWRLDPTIQSVLLMLDAIHVRFASSRGLFSRLIDEEHPAITFQILDLNYFGLSDDLYIKMNARGKPLTPFETFKARYEEKLKSQNIQGEFLIARKRYNTVEYVSHRMDTTWADLYWKHRDKKSNQIDQAFMNLIRTIALVTRDPDDESFLMDVNKLKSSEEGELPAFNDFHKRGWLDKRFTLRLIHLLDAWSSESGELTCLLPNGRYFDEKSFFQKIVLNHDSLSYTEIIQFAAYVAFIDKHYDAINPDAFQKWMRIVYNLSTNTIYNRVGDFQRSIRGLEGLLEHSLDILKHFAKTENVTTGFYEVQIAEEILKAKLILAENPWRVLIDRAEHHGYFRGQIGFLLDFCGIVEADKEAAPNQWDSSKHKSLQVRFEQYLDLAEKTFLDYGLNDVKPGSFLWQRALLSIGDYLLPRGSNHSFLDNSINDETSWKRLLRGVGNHPEPREFLKQLWDHLSANEDLTPQLERIILADHQVEPWRQAMIHCPEAFEYCGKYYIRKEEHGKVYLLRRTQLNGFHAELFTYCLFKEPANFTNLSPNYSDVCDTYSEPCIRYGYNIRDIAGGFSVYCHNKVFLIKISQVDCLKIPHLDKKLRDMGFNNEDDHFFQDMLNRSEILALLHRLDDSLGSLSC